MTGSLFLDSINDVPQLPINTFSLSLQPLSPPQFLGWTFWGDVMNAISVVSVQAIAGAQAYDHSPTTIALFCAIGLVASLCVAVFGVDLSVG
jgi:hypothetical protein